MISSNFLISSTKIHETTAGSFVSLQVTYNIRLFVVLGTRPTLNNSCPTAVPAQSSAQVRLAFHLSAQQCQIDSDSSATCSYGLSEIILRTFRYKMEMSRLQALFVPSVLPCRGRNCVLSLPGPSHLQGPGCDDLSVCPLMACPRW